MRYCRKYFLSTLSTGRTVVRAIDNVSLILLSSMSRVFVVFLITGIVVASSIARAARILGIFPVPSISHQTVFRGLTLALHERGHELVIVTTDPLRDQTLKNYTEIDASFLYRTNHSNHIENRKKHHWGLLANNLASWVQGLANDVLKTPEMMKLYELESNERFDLVIIELFFTHPFYPLVKRFDAPWIGISSLGLDLTSQYAIGNPVMPSHSSNWEMTDEVGKELTFWKRLNDYIDVWLYLHHFHTHTIRNAEEIARKYFGDYGSTITEIARNASLVFAYQQIPISFTRPDVPKVIRIGGFPVSRQTTSLTKELKEFLDGAEDGFVYMSLGSAAKSTMMSNATRQSFITAFSKLPYKILWKFEEDILPRKPSNVHVMKWIPQQAVLAHRNIKVFIYQGGLQSTQESISNAVPLIGFPIFSDQDGQITKLVSLGVAKKLEITDVIADHLVQAVTEIATNPGYKQRMLSLRSLINDKSSDPLETAVWWTEHVIRHRGAKYLDSQTAEMAWYRRNDLDLIVFIASSLLTIFILIIGVFYLSIIHIRNLFTLSKKEKVH